MNNSERINGNMDSNKYIKEEQEINISDIISFFWRLKWWIVAFAFVALCVAYFTVKMMTPIYTRSSQVMLVDESSGANSELTLLADITGKSQSSKIDNEIFILKSPSMMTKVVKDNNLNYRYFQYKLPLFHTEKNLLKSILNIKKVELYNQESPLSIRFLSTNKEGETPQYIKVYIKVIDEKIYKIKKIKINNDEIDMKSKEHYFSSPIVLNNLNIMISVSNPNILEFGSEYECVYNTPYRTALEFCKSLSAHIEKGDNKTVTDVISLSLQDSKPRRAEDILNCLIVKYNLESREFKNISVKASLDFINTRLEAISAELGSAETEIRDYQLGKTLINIETQSEMTLTSDLQYETQLNEVNLQQNILNFIKEDLAATPAGEYRIIPSNVGVADDGLNGVIENYNTLILERNRLLSNSSETNPRVLMLSNQLYDTKRGLELTIQNLDKVYSLRAKELTNILDISKKKLVDIPTQQLDLVKISRRQQVIEPLFLLLQQKKEEAQISMYSVSDKVRVIESAYGSPFPIEPKKSIIYLMALILGAIIPPGFMFIRNLLKTKVETKEDVTSKLDAPILATIPKSETGQLIDSAHSRDTLSESFRMLRSNLKFIDAKVIQVTSSVSGEGKSYIASNLAITLSQINKKVLLVGLDMRKPVLKKVFSKLKLSSDRSVLSYLIGKTTNIADTIVPTGYDNFDLAFSGVVPPNPTELLSTEKLKDLMDYYREHYDYVVCDSAPFMPVSDAFLVNRYVDMTLYVIRSEYTSLKLLDDINTVFSLGKIKSPNIILNNVDINSNKFKYGYGYGSGYGYGYGSCYGYGYGESDNKDKGLKSRIKNKILHKK